MNLIARLLLVGGVCLLTAFGADCGDKKAAPEPSAPLVTSDVSADKAAVWGAEVLRAVAASEPAIVARHAAHMSTRMGKIRGGGMVFSASCKQKFSVSQERGAGQAERCVPGGPGAHPGPQGFKLVRRAQPLNSTLRGRRVTRDGASDVG